MKKKFLEQDPEELKRIYNQLYGEAISRVKGAWTDEDDTLTESRMAKKEVVIINKENKNNIKELVLEYDYFKIGKFNLNIVSNVKRYNVIFLNGNLTEDVEIDLKKGLKKIDVANDYRFNDSEFVKFFKIPPKHLGKKATNLKHEFCEATEEDVAKFIRFLHKLEKLQFFI